MRVANKNKSIINKSWIKAPLGIIGIKEEDDEDDEDDERQRLKSQDFKIDMKPVIEEELNPKLKGEALPPPPPMFQGNKLLQNNNPFKMSP